MPLDLYIMLDQSSSMSDSVPGGTKWKAVTSAINTFVGQPNTTGISVGLQYFALPQQGGPTCSTLACTTTADCGPAACGPCVLGVCTGAVGGGGDSCTAADYAHADVEIAALPAVGPHITQSMNGHSPSTSTPTSAALQGAIDHAKAWGTAHAGDAVAVVLATDGDPTECDTNLSHIDAIAAAGLSGTPRVETFVIGVGPDTTNLNSIAMAGGTMSAFLVDTNANVNQQFLNAMNAIRQSATCRFQIPVPQSGTPNYMQVNVVYTPSGGQPTTIPYVQSQAMCPANGNGWYYDNPNMPTQIVLCPTSCGTVTADTSGTVNIALGCTTVIL